jgi:glutathione S-transferase
VPILELDDGTIRSQSNAILWFVGEGTQFVPGDPLERAQVVQWLIFEQERVMAGIGGARFRTLTGRAPEVIPARQAVGRSALEMLEEHLDGRSYLVGSSCSIADVANYAYTHVADEAGLDLGQYQAIDAWLRRVEALPRFVDDLTPYPENARAELSRSIYDE